jgi:transaldolase
MKFFVDSADTAQIKDLAATGLVDGVTTNPSLVAKTGRPFFDVLAEICALVPGPVSAEVAATDTATMVAEGRRLARLAENIVIKVPLTPDGLKACRSLSDEGIGVNVTLCFSPAQGLLAAKAGAAFVSPFVGRLDDVGADGMGVIRDLVAIYRNFPHFGTEVLVASVRNKEHVVEAAKLGAGVATIPPGVLRELFHHPLTDKGLEAFLADWAKTGQSIIEVSEEAGDGTQPERRSA